MNELHAPALPQGVGAQNPPEQLLLQHSLELPQAAAGSRQQELVAMLHPSRAPHDGAAAH